MNFLQYLVLSVVFARLAPQHLLLPSLSISYVLFGFLAGQEKHVLVAGSWLVDGPRGAVNTTENECVLFFSINSGSKPALGVILCNLPWRTCFSRGGWSR